MCAATTMAFTTRSLRNTGGGGGGGGSLGRSAAGAKVGPGSYVGQDAYNITHQLWYHQGMDAKAQRSFPYAADDGTPRAFLVGDILPRDGPGALLRALGLAGLGAAATLGDFTRRP